MENIITNFGKNIKSLREDSGLTQEALADKIGVTRQTIAKWESNEQKTGPTLDVIEIIAKVFDMTPIELLKSNKPKTNEWKSHYSKSDSNKKRAIIGGKTYDCETAFLIGEYSNNLGYRDFRFVNEELYRKENGEFFLYGEGGPMTEYSESVGNNSYTGGERIRPLSDTETKKWLEKRHWNSDYINLFGLPDE